jgi:type III pantothenate kinase
VQASPITLLLDLGNTRLKLAVWHPGQTGFIAIDGHAHSNLKQLLDWREQTLDALEGEPVIAYGVSVASPDVMAAIESLLRGRRTSPSMRWVWPQAQYHGVVNTYPSPSQLGADRWAALIGAHHTHAQACLVVTAGTATTADLLSADGDFLGGLILPGVDLMQASLARGTAQLPLAEGRFVPQPRCTVDAIRSGCLHAQAGAIERMFRQIATERGALCLLGGGAADSFAGLLDIPLRRIDNLVLCGLAVIA